MASKRTLSVEDIYNRGCRAKGSELTIALHKFIYDKQFEKFIHLLSSSRHSLDTQIKSDAALTVKVWGRFVD
ncbi:hypothetical protein [Piscirickettsia salmonis]|uniref:hypothetical protein n=1 Tax=Piscirickettsia salmonis TaxID=1238 RepID=UPI001013D70C|nr:hypothetical protein [Piscirickettsia salmonis]